MGGGVGMGVGLALTMFSLRCLLWLTSGEVSEATGATVLGSQGETGPAMETWSHWPIREKLSPLVVHRCIIRKENGRLRPVSS